MIPAMNTTRNLPRLAGVLEQTGFPVHLIGESESMPVSQLLVALDEDDRPEISYPLRVFYQEDALILAEPEDSPLAPELEESATLCFLLELERELPSDRLLDLYRILNVWNGIVPLGTLGVLENAPQGLYYRYALPHDEGFNLLLVAEILDQIGFYLNRLLPLLDRWLVEGGPVEELLQDSERELAQEALALLQKEAGGLE